MKQMKIFALVFLTAILSLSFVSAANVFPTDITGNDLTMNPGAQGTINFKIQNNFNTEIENFKILLPYFGTDGSWTSAKLGSTTLSISQTNEISVGNLNIKDSTKSNQFTLVYTTNGHILSNVYSKEIDFSGNYIGGSSFVTDNLLFSFTINPTPSISVADSTITASSEHASVVVTNTGNVDLTNVLVSAEDVDGLDFEDVTIATLNAGESKTAEVPVDVSESSLNLGTNSAVVTVTAGTNTATGKITLNKQYCEVGNIGVLSLDRLKFTNKGTGDKDEWFLTDEIEVEVRVENTDGDNKVRNVIVAWGLYDEANDEWIIDDEESDFTLNKDEKKTITFSFTIDPSDFDEDYSENDFVFYIKAYSDDEGEDLQCDSDSQDVTIRKDDDYVILDSLELTSDTIPCGKELSGSFTAWNIGDNTEDEVFVMITNEELGINEKVDIGDIDILEDIKRTFSFMIPNNAEEKTHIIWFKVYDEDGDIFENDDNDEAVFTKTFNVQGSCQGGSDVSGSGKVKITAVNDPETPRAIAGNKFMIDVTLTNTANTPATYAISVSGNSGWSSLDSIEPQLVNLGAGESREIIITLSIDADAKGDKEITIKAGSSDEIVEQKATLTIYNEQAEPQFDAFTKHIRKNWFIYVIVLINVILIIAIILVVRSMVRPREVYG